MSDLSIRFNNDPIHPALEFIRKQSSAEGWAGTSGRIEFVKERYNATLRKNQHGYFTSIKFNDEQSLTEFLTKMENQE